MPKVKYPTTCSISGCSINHYAKGFCKQHYMSANRNEFNPANTSLKKPDFDYEDFWQFVKKELNIG